MMKTKAIQILFSAALVFLFSAGNVQAVPITVDGLELLNGYKLEAYAKDSYLIQSVDDWNALADYVAAGNTCEGLTFKMKKHIGSASQPVTRMIGCQANSDKTSRKRFAGAFDGNGMTLTVDLTSANTNKGYCAPFAYVKALTIKNLHVTGTITASGQWASGLVGSSGNDDKDGKCYIKGCHVSVTIISKYTSKQNSYANHGAFIGIAEGVATLENCWFDGSFQVEGNGDFEYSGGFIGLNKAQNTKFVNCLFNAASCDVPAANAGQFANSVKGSIDNTSTYYYVTSFGTKTQGTLAFTSEPIGFNTTTMTLADGKEYLVSVGKVPVDLPVHAASLLNRERYWTTFYTSYQSFKLDAGVLAFMMDETGALFVVGNGNIVPAGCAVVLMAEPSVVKNGTIKLRTTGENATPAAGNVLKGSDTAVAVSSGTAYVLGVNDKGEIGFYLAGTEVPANKAYIVKQ
jgi:hypothetical protein